MGWLRNKIKKAVNTVVNKVKETVTKVVDTAKDLAGKAMDVVSQMGNFLKSAIKMATTPFQMMGALLQGKGLDGARDIWVNNASEFGQEFNKLVDTALVLGVAALEATPMGSVLQKVPGYEIVKSVIVDTIGSVFKSIGNTVQSAAAVVGAIGEESFKSVMKKVGDFALNALELASNFVPAGKVATVIGRAALAVEAGFTAKMLSTEEGRTAFKDGLKAMKENPEMAATLAVGFAASGMPMGGGGGTRSVDVPGGGVKPGGGSMPGGGATKLDASSPDTKTKSAGDSDGLGDTLDAAEEAAWTGLDMVNVATMSAPMAGSGGGDQSVASMFPGFASFNVMNPLDLTMLMTGRDKDDEGGATGTASLDAPMRRTPVAA